MQVNASKCITTRLCHPCLAKSACPKQNIDINHLGKGYVIASEKCLPCQDEHNGVCVAQTPCQSAKNIVNMSSHHPLDPSEIISAVEVG